jgi:cation diffusion facilitator family transporter
MLAQDRYWEAKKVTIIGAFVNFLLGVFKLIGGYLFHSHALIADGFHSFSDLFTDMMVVFASKYGSQDADESHPYGHQRIETAATCILALLLILAGAAIAWDALYELLYAASTKPHWLALPIALFSLLINELLFQYTHHVGQKIQSALIIANAWHHRSDAAASFVVLIGLLGSLAGFIYLDAVAAVIVGCLIIKMGLEYGWNSIKELVDTAVPPEVVATIEQLVSSVNGVVKIHQLRTRSMGADIFIDMHILVNPYISVSEGHYIAQQVDRILTREIKSVKDVTIHVDPEDDEIACPSLNCPNRKLLEDQFLTDIQTRYPDILFCNLHYLDGMMILDLTLNNQFNNWTELKTELEKCFLLEQKCIEIRLFSFQESIKNPEALANSTR